MKSGTRPLTMRVACVTLAVPDGGPLLVRLCLVLLCCLLPSRGALSDGTALGSRLRCLLSSSLEI